MLEQKIRKITRDLVQRDAEDKRRNPYAYDGFQSLYTSCIWSRLVPILPFIEMNHIVADFGCGLGWNAKLMSLFCQKVIGIDKSSEAIAVAKKKSGTTNTEWICGDMSESLLSEKSIDLAVCIQALEHLDSKQMRRFFLNVSKALRGKGLLIGSTTEFRECSVVQASHGHRFEPSRKDFVRFSSEFFDIEKMENVSLRNWDRFGENVEGFFVLKCKETICG